VDASRRRSIGGVSGRARACASVLSLIASAFLRVASARADDAGLAKARDASDVRPALHTLIDELVGADRTMRRAAAHTIDTLGDSAIPLMTEELARQRPGHPPKEIQAVLERARARADASDDCLDAALELAPETSGGGYAQTIVTLTLVHALARIGTPEAVAALAPVALDARGAFASDVTYQLAALGERATAGLVLMSHARSVAAKKWAVSELEALGKRTPGDAVQTKSKEILADVLLVYGTTQDADALPVVMSFVNADRRLVRDAARESLARYGDLAAPKLRESFGLLNGEPAPTDWPTAWLRGKLFEALDRVRLEDVDAHVRRGQQLAADGRYREAVADFDDVLARQPDWSHKAELVPAYVFYAQSEMASDRAHAEQLFERALALDPDGPRASQIRSELALLAGEALEARGVTDEGPYRLALELDPANAEAAGKLARIGDERRLRKKRWERREIEGGAGLLVVSAVILFAGAGRRRRARDKSGR